MPYASAPYWIAGLVALTIFAFWPFYFSSFGSAPAAAHFHAATAFAWMALLFTQSLAIDRGWRGIHRSAGRASLLLAPLFLAGGFWVVQTGNEASTPFGETVGLRLAFQDLASLFGFGYFYFQALRTRRKATLHGGYMLATCLLLLYPTVFRLLPTHIPMLAINGPDDFVNVEISVHISNALTVAFAFWIAHRSQEGGRPFAEVAGVAALSSLALVSFTRLDAWEFVPRGVGALPATAVFASGLVFGATCSILGWRTCTSRS
ncbi:MAG: hypothetical protein AAFR11_00655 [Pseudomonadota bacterium]